MKKIVNIFIISIMLFSVMVVPAFADIGPKPLVVINLDNAPEEKYYLDLLYQPLDHKLYENIDIEEYDAKMVDLLFRYKDAGWVPALAGGTVVPTFGKLTASENGQHRISYFGVPDTFKVIVVTESGTVKVSEEITRDVLQIQLNMDYETMGYSQPPKWLSYAKQFLFTCVLTLVVEGLILLLFGFTLKKNLKVFVWVNVFTQLIFTAVFSTVFVNSGYLSCMVVFIPIEIGVVLVETFLYRALLQGHTRKRRATYALVANVATALLTWVSFDVLFEFMKIVG